MECPMDVVLSFETTGAMSQVLDEVKAHVYELVQRLQTDISDFKVGIIAHGHLGRDIIVQNLTPSPSDIVNFMKEISGTEDFDISKYYELALRQIRNMTWTPGSKRMLIVIGQACPHQHDHTYVYNIRNDWQRELSAFDANNLRVYGVQYGQDPESTNFFQSLASEFGGQHLQLQDVGDICRIIKAICFCEQGLYVYMKYETEVRAEYKDDAMGCSLETAMEKLRKTSPRIRQHDDPTWIMRDAYDSDYAPNLHLHSEQVTEQGQREIKMRPRKASTLILSNQGHTSTSERPGVFQPLPKSNSCESSIEHPYLFCQKTNSSDCNISLGTESSRFAKSNIFANAGFQTSLFGSLSSSDESGEESFTDSDSDDDSNNSSGEEEDNRFLVNAEDLGDLYDSDHDSDYAPDLHLHSEQVTELGQRERMRLRKNATLNLSRQGHNSTPENAGLFQPLPELDSCQSSIEPSDLFCQKTNASDRNISLGTESSRVVKPNIFANDGFHTSMCGSLSSSDESEEESFTASESDDDDDSNESSGEEEDNRFLVNAEDLGDLYDSDQDSDYAPDLHLHSEQVTEPGQRERMRLRKAPTLSLPSQGHNSTSENADLFQPLPKSKTFQTNMDQSKSFGQNINTNDCHKSLGTESSRVVKSNIFSNAGFHTSLFGRLSSSDESDEGSFTASESDVDNGSNDSSGEEEDNRFLVNAEDQGDLYDSDQDSDYNPDAPVPTKPLKQKQAQKDGFKKRGLQHSPPKAAKLDMQAKSKRRSANDCKKQNQIPESLDRAKREYVGANQFKFLHQPWSTWHLAAYDPSVGKMSIAGKWKTITQRVKGCDHRKALWRQDLLSSCRSRMEREFGQTGSRKRRKESSDSGVLFEVGIMSPSSREIKAVWFHAIRQNRLGSPIIPQVMFLPWYSGLMRDIRTPLMNSVWEGSRVYVRWAVVNRVLTLKKAILQQYQYLWRPQRP